MAAEAASGAESAPPSLEEMAQVLGELEEVRFYNDELTSFNDRLTRELESLKFAKATQGQLARLIRDCKLEKKRFISLDELDALLNGF